MKEEAAGECQLMRRVWCAVCRWKLYVVLFVIVLGLQRFGWWLRVFCLILFGGWCSRLDHCEFERCWVLWRQIIVLCFCRSVWRIMEGSECNYLGSSKANNWDGVDILCWEEMTTFEFNGGWRGWHVLVSTGGELVKN